MSRVVRNADAVDEEKVYSALVVNPDRQREIESAIGKWRRGWGPNHSRTEAITAILMLGVLELERMSPKTRGHLDRPDESVHIDLTPHQAAFLKAGVKELRALESEKSEQEIVDGLLWIGLETAKKWKAAEEHDR